MRYDIVAFRRNYRGIGRSLLAAHLNTPKANKYFDELLDIYFQYVGLCEKTDQITFESMLACYKTFAAYDIPCELIAYDTAPITNVYGHSVEFLGIDIVCDLCESLIEDGVHPDVTHLLNENGLCQTAGDIATIIPLQKHGMASWLPCYVYRIKITGDSESSEKTE